MTRKDYQLIADIINDFVKIATSDNMDASDEVKEAILKAIENLQAHTCYMLDSEFENFDRLKFNEALFIPHFNFINEARNLKISWLSKLY